MAREIKFRAWDCDNSNMYEVGDNFGTTLPHEPLIYKYQGQNVEVMQYTGLKDKNGVEIYEGDIVKSRPSGELRVIEFIGAGFVINNGYMSFVLNETRAMSMSVIGNIYENPELLEHDNA